MATYANGQSVRLVGTYTGADGDLGEPNDAMLRVRKPNGVVTAYTYLEGTVSRISDGQYGKTLSAIGAGRWMYEFSDAGGDEETPVRVGYFDVAPSF